MKKLILTLTMLTSSLVFAGDPSASFLSKKLTAPVAGPTKMTVGQYVGEGLSGFGSGKAEGSWKKSGSSWVHTLKYRDKVSMKKQELVQTFDNEATKAILTDVIYEGKKLPPDLSVQIVLGVAQKLHMVEDVKPSTAVPKSSDEEAARRKFAEDQRKFDEQMKKGSGN